VKCALVSPAPCFSQNIHLFFLFKKIAAKERLVSELGLKMWQSLAVGGSLLDFRGEILLCGVKFFGWDDWNGLCGTKNDGMLYGNQRKALQRTMSVLSRCTQRVYEY
jgi:hypothetical protein